MVTEHKNALWVNNCRSQVERRAWTPDLPSMESELLKPHVLYRSLLWGPDSRHPEGLWFMGKILGYREKGEREPRPAQQNWPEHHAFSSSLHNLIPEGWRDPELRLLRLLWFWASSPWRKSMAIYQHKRTVIIIIIINKYSSATCAGSCSKGSYGNAFVIRKSWAPILVLTMHWPWASNPTLWAWVFPVHKLILKPHRIVRRV